MPFGSLNPNCDWLNLKSVFFFFLNPNIPVSRKGWLKVWFPLPHMFVQLRPCKNRSYNQSLGGPRVKAAKRRHFLYRDKESCETHDYSDSSSNSDNDPHNPDPRPTPSPVPEDDPQIELLRSLPRQVLAEAIGSLFNDDAHDVEISPRGQSTGFNSGESHCNPVAYILHQMSSSQQLTQLYTATPNPTHEPVGNTYLPTLSHSRKHPKCTPGLTALNTGYLIPEAIRKKFTGTTDWRGSTPGPLTVPQIFQRCACQTAAQVKFLRYCPSPTRPGPGRVNPDPCQSLTGTEGWKTHVPLQYLTDKFCAFANQATTKELNDMFVMDGSSGIMISTAKELDVDPELSFSFDE
ncbi:hypothetical protein B0H19DRAFT_1085581 [Mycena capillaripes]|nr:hypothetical protein B0H19DRAFT_1085581 [Mycena capillaripes]